jgi:predicted acylesterase/phospholipase RssA
MPEHTRPPTSTIPFSSRLSWAVLALTLIAAFGCAVRRQTLQREDLEIRRLWTEAAVASHMRQTVERTVRRMEREIAEHEAGGPAPVLDVLVISGGGDYGAFGAGVLEGWGSVTDPVMARPVFDVVTGVSTGALIAPFALLGDEDSYHRILELYENPKKDWITLRDIFFFLPGRESFMNTSGLERDVKEQVNSDVIRRIAEAAAEDRTLAIGTTNLDLGRMHPWDLTTEASRIVTGEKTEERFHKVLMASAAIPAIFPPVVIDDTLYVDGGTTSNILYDSDLRSKEAPLAIFLRRNPGKEPPRSRFWVIINNQLGGEPQVVQPTWVSITEASVATAIRSSTIGTLRQLYLTTELQRLEGRGIEFRFIAIPDTWRPPVSGAFKKETMKSLADLGRRLGADASSWCTNLSSVQNSVGDGDPSRIEGP